MERDVTDYDLQLLTLHYKDFGNGEGGYVLRTSAKWLKELGDNCIKMYGGDETDSVQTAKNHLVKDLGFQSKDIKEKTLGDNEVMVEICFNDCSKNQTVLSQFRGAQKSKNIDYIRNCNLYESVLSRMVFDGSINDDVLLYLTMTERGYGADTQIKNASYKDKNPAKYRHTQQLLESDPSLRIMLREGKNAAMIEEAKSKGGRQFENASLFSHIQSKVYEM